MAGRCELLPGMQLGYKRVHARPSSVCSGGQLAHAAIWGQDGGIWAQVCIECCALQKRVDDVRFACCHASPRLRAYSGKRALLSRALAQDASFPAVTPEEIAALVAGFNDPSQLAMVRAAHELVASCVRLFGMLFLVAGAWEDHLLISTPVLVVGAPGGQPAEGGLPTSCMLQNGIRIGGEKYMMVAGEPGVVLRGKKGPSKPRRAHAAAVGAYRYKLAAAAALLLCGACRIVPPLALGAGSLRPTLRCCMLRLCSRLHAEEDAHGSGGGHLRRGCAAR